MAQDDYIGTNRAQVGRTDAGTNVLSIISFVLAAVAVLFIPILFGALALIAAVIGLVRKERLAKVAVVVAVVATILGIVLGNIVLNAMS